MTEEQTHVEIEQRVGAFGYEGMKQGLAEISLSESQDRYRDLVETVNDLIWEVDVDMHYTYLSPKTQDMFGYKPEELIGKVFTHLMPPDETDRLINVFNTFASEPASFTSIEATVIHKDGHPVFLENSGKPFFDRNGNLSGFRGVIRDISERKKAQDELLRIQKAIDSTSDAIGISDPQGNHFYHNKAFYNMFGYTVDELLAAGGPPAISLNPDTVKEVFEATMSGNAWNGEAELISKSGRQFPVYLRADAIRDESGNIIGLIAVHTDISKQKRVEEDLKHHRDQLLVFKQFAEESAQGMGWADMEGRIIHVNTALSHLFGVQKPEDVYGKIVQSTFYPEHIEKRLNDVIFPAVLKEGKWEGESEIRTVHGKSLPTYESIFLIRDKEENPLYFANVLSDMTERKLAENTLKDNEEKYRTLFADAGDALFILDVDPEFRSRFIECNQRTLALFGCEMDDIIGKTPGPFSPELQPDGMSSMEKAFELTRRVMDGRPQNFEWLHHRYDNGKPFFVEVALSRLTLGGKSNYIQAVVRDITGRKQAEEALKESEAKYRSMMETMTDSVYICSQDFRIEYMNPAMINRIGFDATGNACHRVIYDKDEQCPWCIFDKIQKGKHLAYEVVNPKDNRNYSVSNSPVCNSDGTVSKLTIFRDITKIKAMEKQINQSQKMESIGTLAGGIAHNFNNMLGIILGNSELAKSNIPDNISANNNIDRIRTACLRAKEMVKQILAFSGQTNAALQPLTIGPIIAESLKLIRPIIPATIEIRRDISTELRAVLADSAQLNQIVLHLCTNAAHSMKDKGGLLEVNLKNVALDKITMKDYHGLGPGNYVELNVRDTGCGIDKKAIDQIYDPFFTTKEIGEGSGMGLSIIHGIVKEHNGDILVHSEPEKGTSFHVLFPAIENERPPKRKSEKLPLGNGEKILFIDDEESLVFASKQSLEDLGYEVVTENNPVNALNVFQKDPEAFDLIITDISMPEMTGLRLCEEIMKIRSKIPIILCSGYREHISEQKAKALGVKTFLLKPYLVNEMATKIRMVLNEEHEKDSSPKQILLIDDEESMRSTLRAMLESSGYDVMEAPDGNVGLWLFKEKPADLIITDLLMPEKEGIETIIELKQNFSDVKIIAITGGGRGGIQAYLDLAKKVGADSTLAKPFEKVELLREVKDLLDR